MQILAALLSFSVTIHSPSSLQPADTLKASSLLLNGTAYSKNFTPDMGSPFLMIDSTVGTIQYNGNWYSGVGFYYDCEDDVLLLKDADGLFWIELVKKKTAAFRISGRQFVKRKLESATESFYELAWQGKKSLLVKWKKMRINGSDFQLHYQLSAKLFLSDENGFTEIRSIDDIASYYKIKGAPVKQQLKSRKLNYKKDPVQTALAAVQYIETNGQ